MAKLSDKSLSLSRSLAASRPLAAIMMIAALLIPAPPVMATCGGGGGGGTGGMRSGSGNGPNGPADEVVYNVPWKLIQPQDPAIAAGLVLYWFPSSNEEVKRSSLRNSRALTMYAQQCVTMGIADAGTSLGQKFVADSKLPVVVLTEANGTVVSKLENEKGFLKVDRVEKLVETEIKKREAAVKEKMDAAKNKAKGGDNNGAIDEYRAVLAQRCLFPSRAKDAAKELKKLGVTDVGRIFDSPVFAPRESAKIERTMQNGLWAEDNARYEVAERYYSAAHQMDPADSVPLRYLGELQRHHLGQWDAAEATFKKILDMPADPLSRAVALHGIGKMTIHNGDFKKGLSLMEASVREFPLALAYRNLAVYWNSEGDAAKTDEYTRKALALDPDDPFNLVFAAAFLAENGHIDEALKIARENETLLCASYNLAAIYAQAGRRDKAIELLRRHFFEYERYASVRSKEMMEARVDAVFGSLRSDAAFVTLTADADGKLDPSRTMTTTRPQ